MNLKAVHEWNFQLFYWITDFWCNFSCDKVWSFLSWLFEWTINENFCHKIKSFILIKKVFALCFAFMLLFFLWYISGFYQQFTKKMCFTLKNEEKKTDKCSTIFCPFQISGIQFMCNDDDFNGLTKNENMDWIVENGQSYVVYPLL